MFMSCVCINVVKIDKVVNGVRIIICGCIPPTLLVSSRVYDYYEKMILEFKELKITGK